MKSSTGYRLKIKCYKKINGKKINGKKIEFGKAKKLKVKTYNNTNGYFAKNIELNEKWSNIKMTKKKKPAIKK